MITTCCCCCLRSSELGGPQQPRARGAVLHAGRGAGSSTVFRLSLALFLLFKMVKKTKLKNALNKNKAANQKLAVQKAKDQVRQRMPEAATATLDLRPD